MKVIFLLIVFVPLLCVNAFGQRNPSTIEGKRNSKVVQLVTLEPEKTPTERAIEPTNIVFLKLLPDRPMRLISKPRAPYPDQSHGTICVQGTVILRVVFLYTGEIGNIAVVKGLPNGLIDKAIEAAKKIQFEPAIKNGQPVSVTKQVEYSFSIY